MKDETTPQKPRDELISKSIEKPIKPQVWKAKAIHSAVEHCVPLPDFVDANAYASLERELEQSKFVPGEWRCAKCDLILHAKVISMKSGNIGANTNPQECSNGCGPMWKVTWKELRERQIESAERMFEKIEELQSKLALAVELAQEAVDLVGSLPACSPGVAETYEKWCETLTKLKGEAKND